jgi:uncharacterized membrane protein YgdD (TMEM256/DUF423 family)
MSADRLKMAAALSAALAIAAGAFGAHAVSGVQAEWLKTGGFYQLVHAVAVIAIMQSGGRARPSWLMLIGSWVFAFSLYAMAFGAPRWLGAITPIGGVMMIAAWLWVVVEASRRS